MAKKIIRVEIHPVKDGTGDHHLVSVYQNHPNEVYRFKHKESGELLDHLANHLNLPMDEEPSRDGAEPDEGSF